MLSSHALIYIILAVAWAGFMALLYLLGGDPDNSIEHHQEGGKPGTDQDDPERDGTAEAAMGGKKALAA